MYKPHHFSAKYMLKTLHCVSTFFDLLQLYFSILKYVGQHLFFGAVNIFSIHRAAVIRFRFWQQAIFYSFAVIRQVCIFPMTAMLFLFYPPVEMGFIAREKKKEI